MRVSKEADRHAPRHVGLQDLTLIIWRMLILIIDAPSFGLESGVFVRWSLTNTFASRASLLSGKSGRAWLHHALRRKVHTAKKLYAAVEHSDLLNRQRALAVGHLEAPANAALCGVCPIG